MVSLLKSLAKVEKNNLCFMQIYNSDIDISRSSNLRQRKEPVLISCVTRSAFTQKTIMSRLILTFIAVLFLVYHPSAQQRFSVSGEIRSSEDGETLIGATVSAPALGLGTTTNEYGFYSLTLPAADSLLLEFSYVGYQTVYRRISLRSSLTINVELSSGIQIQEIVVKANSFREKIRNTEMSTEEISAGKVKLLPVLLGESDILKALQLKPGIPQTTSTFQGTSEGDAWLAGLQLNYLF